MPNNWKKYKLKDICNKISVGFVGTISNHYTNKENGIPILRSKNVRPGRIDIHDLEYITRDFHNKEKKSHLFPGDIVIVRVGQNRGDVCKITDMFAELNVANCVFLRPPNEYSNFLEHLLRSPSGQQLLLSISSGSAQLVLNTGDIAELEVTLPEQTEAMAIAEILSSLDDKIELNLQTNKTLEEMANALYKHWFVDFGPFQEGKFIESELGLIPEGFKSVSFKDVCFNHSKTYNFKGKEKVVFVNTGDILEGKFLHNNYSDVEGLPGQAKKIIEPDDILFSEIRPGNKRYALIISDTSDYVVSTKFMVIRTNENILPRILYRILREEKIIKEFQSIAESRSGTFPQITFDAISGISFPMSNIEIQNQFMEKVLPLEQLIDSNNIEIESLKQTRDYLLPKLISGEIRLKDAAKKVKEVL